MRHHHHGAMPRHFAPPPPPPPQPYYAYPRPERGLPDSSSVEDTPTFGAPPLLTPASTLSPQSVWQSPQPDVLPQGSMDGWGEFDFNDLHHTMPPTSDPTSSSQPHGQMGVGNQVDFGSAPDGSFAGDGTEDQGFSAFSHMPELGYQGDEGLQGMLQRQLDECASLSVF